VSDYMHYSHQYIKDISDRLNTISSHKANAYSSNGFEDYDDEYYLDMGSEPLRFAYYRHIRVEQCDDEYRKKTFECVHDSITQDQLHYYLKRKLRVTPEQRYQDKKEDWFFHESSWYSRGLDATGYDGQGCNQFTGCVPECMFYLPYGRIEDDKVIQEHKEVEEHYRKRNAIINIDINTKDFIEFVKRFYNI
jgi:hypothetical protein